MKPSRYPLPDLHILTTATETGNYTTRAVYACIVILGSVIVTSLAAWLLVRGGFPSPENLNVLFVIPVLTAAVFYGLRAALISVVLSILAYDLILLSPIWNIELWEPENVAKIVVLSFVAIVASALSSRIRLLAKEALQRERVISGVYALSQDMLGIANVDDMRRKAESKLSDLLHSKARILLAPEIELLDSAALFCLANNTPTGGGTSHFGDNPNLYLPLCSSQAVIGLLAVESGVAGRFSFKTLATLVAQVASAVEKARLAEEHEQKARDAEREKFLSALLSSVSHDLKTPLVTVIGALSSIKDMPVVQQNPNMREVAAGGLEEAQKLNRFITNLVEISRLEFGTENIRKDPVSLRDLLASALKTLHPLIAEQQFSIETEPNFPLLRVNPALMELVFLNLLENAIKYGPTQCEIKIIAATNDTGATIDVDDDGDGIPESERKIVFEKFYRSQQGDRKIAGTGLGLYICRGIVEAHGGTIAAIDPYDGKGACLRIQLPWNTLVAFDIEKEAEEVGHEDE